MSAREAARVAGWNFTCLPCNATWIGTAADHRCAHREAYRRTFWIRRLAFAKLGMPQVELERLVDAPIARATMVALLGPSWAVEADPK